jgi:hypothetical protein
MRLTRPLPLFLALALVAGCAGGNANLPVTRSAQSDSTQSISAQTSFKLDEAKHLKIRLIAPLDATLTRTGLVLSLTNAECKRKHVPERLSKEGFPLAATPFTMPHTAWITIGVTAFENPCTKRGKHAEAVHRMTVATPAPIPSSTPVFGDAGLYVVALDANANGRISAIDVSGPATTGDDGLLHFTLSKLSLSADDTFGFYLAALSTHGHDSHEGDEGDSDDD